MRIPVAAYATVGGLAALAALFIASALLPLPDRVVALWTSIEDGSQGRGTVYRLAIGLAGFGVLLVLGGLCVWCSVAIARSILKKRQVRVTPIGIVVHAGQKQACRMEWDVAQAVLLDGTDEASDATVEAQRRLRRMPADARCLILSLAEAMDDSTETFDLAIGELVAKGVLVPTP
jgi:hypothetical protein